MSDTQRFDTQRLYDLLPDIYRIRDAEQGEPLKAVLSAIAQQIAVLDENLEQLYEDQFIETCADWVVPYLGDLIGYRSLHGVTATLSSPRAEVANTIGYRRRKGTTSVLAQLAQDVTGWEATVVEFFQHLGTTQFLNHIRPQHTQTPDLRRWKSLERINTPFDRLAHTLDVRRIESQQGRYNIPNIGVFLWRLQGCRMVQGTARAIAADGRYTFNPLGLDAPLFNQPQIHQSQPIPELTQAEPQDFTAPLSRRELYTDLEARREAIATAQPISQTYFQDSSADVFQVFLDEPTAVKPEDLQICNLSDWRRPQAPIRAAIDPVLGRLTLPLGVQPQRVAVTYTYGFSHAMGGGSYDRSASVLPLLQRPVTWQVGVSQTQPAVADQIFASVSEAIAAWNSQPSGSNGIIAILDNGTYPEAFPSISLIAGSQLLIVAADWLEVDHPDLPGQKQRLPGLVPVGLRPHLQGDLTVQHLVEPETTALGQLILSGLLVEGGLAIAEGNLGSLHIADCTFRGAILADANPQLALSLTHSICGTITLSEKVPQLQISHSIVEGAIATHADTTLQTSTLFGSTTVRSLEASNSILVGKAIAIRRQKGCVRFCYLPTDSQVAQRYRCQPELALTQRAAMLQLNAFTLLSAAERNAIQARLTPLFTSTRYGDPGYGQLSRRCAPEIRQGADDEAEMGAFHDLYQPQREMNLRVRLDEYLRFGLEAGIFYVT
ncbi:MAG TPA: hypothetical protein V6C84_29875 [Coleofasciculaceae cyanobacterium]|jgi:hypothetical protein